ncbi:MAG: hypothetical protein KJZ74_01625 [Gemmatimonadales bacterium]|nr:hypothetical protein [Gemmatimonadota bacterium]MCL4212589.1 hypothetical protein [Gemmatimonadales bacterium]
MRLQSRPVRILVVGLVAALAACDGGSVTPPDGVDLAPSPLSIGTWYLHAANDSVIPATISSRFIGVTPEETIVDSARLIVRVDQYYEQRVWMRVFLNGTLDRTEIMVDEGIWTPTPVDYQFTSSIRPRIFSVTATSGGVVNSLERMVFFANAPVTSGRYRMTRPLP